MSIKKENSDWNGLAQQCQQEMKSLGTKILENDIKGQYKILDKCWHMSSEQIGITLQYLSNKKVIYIKIGNNLEKISIKDQKT